MANHNNKLGRAAEALSSINGKGREIPLEKIAAHIESVTGLQTQVRDRTQLVVDGELIFEVSKAGKGKRARGEARPSYVIKSIQRRLQIRDQAA